MNDGFGSSIGETPQNGIVFWRGNIQAPSVIRFSSVASGALVAQVGDSSLNLTFGLVPVAQRTEVNAVESPT